MQRTIKINRLIRKSIDQLSDLIAGYCIKNTADNANAVIPIWLPVKFLHPSVANQGCIERREVIARDNNRNALNWLRIIAPRKLDIRGAVGNIHQRSGHQLRVHRILRELIDPAHPGVNIVDH